MRKEQQYQGFKLSSQSQLSPSDSSRQSLTQIRQIASQPSNQGPQGIAINRVKHVYLEEQNTYGRFTPFLLLKDKLESQLDSSGHTALHHMCSHNSEYLPLYLSTLNNNDPILNKASKVGHAPLDVAGIYCYKQYVDMLLSKGATDNGNIDHWAIQGGNIYNWTGKVDVNKKHLIHWAAYNDMPHVLSQFYKQGANLSERDGNDFSPIDLTVINKSYSSLKLLVELGFRPKEELVKQSQSKSIRRILDQSNESERRKSVKRTLKLLFVPLFCLLSSFLIYFTNNYSGFQLSYAPILVTFSLWFTLKCLMRVQPQPRYQNTRYSSFHSDIVGSQVSTKSNHFIYYLLNLSLFTTGVITLFQSQTSTYFYAVLYLAQFFITTVYLINSILITYSIAKNLTHQQTFHSYKCKYLWNRIHYVSERKILTRKFNNPLDKGVLQNFKLYFSSNPA